MLEQAHYASVQQYVKIDEEKPLCCKWMMQIISGGDKKRVLFLATEFFVHLFHPKDDGALILSSSHPYCDLKSANQVDTLTFRLTFKQESLIFSEETQSHIMEVLAIHLRSFFLTREMPRIDTATAVDSPTLGSTTSVLMRYRANLYWAKKPPSLDSIHLLSQFLKRNPSSFDVGIMADMGVDLGVFFSAIDICPSISVLILPHRPGSDFYSLVIGLMHENSTIKRISIAYEVEPLFADLLNAISSNYNSNMRHLTFVDCEINLNTVTLISDVVANYQLESISFHKCSIEEVKGPLAALIEREAQSGKLTTIEMTTVWLFDSIELLINSCLRLTHLSLRGCCIPPSEVLAILSHTKSTIKLESLDLSTHRCVEPIRGAINLPVTMRRLTMDDIEWSTDNFILLFKAVCNSSMTIVYSCAHAKLDESGWPRVFNSLEEMKAPCLEGLIWRENPIHAKFCTFVQKAPMLGYLSLAGCVVPSDVSIAKLFDGKALSAVDFHGTKHGRLGRDTKAVITALKRSRSIKRLDLSNQRMGVANLRKFAELIESTSTLRQVICDGNAIATYADFEPLVTALQANRSKITFAYPKEDVAVVKKAPDFPLAKVALLQTLFSDPVKPLNNVPCQEDWLRLVDNVYVELREVEPAPQPKAKPKPPSPVQSNSDALDSPPRTEQKPLNIPPASDQPPPTKPKWSDSDPDRWKMDTVDVLPIDSTPTVIAFRDTFSVANLCARITPIPSA